MSKPISKSVNSTENQQCGHREIIFSVEPGDKQFHLKLQDTRYTWNNIPLGTVPSSPKGTHPKGANVLVPVVPLRYTSLDCEPQKASLLRPGWLYVFCDGRLWRELEIANSGYLRDVNLEHNQKKESRQATGTFDNRVLLPSRVSGKEQTIEMAYSEIQWSWPRINRLQDDATLRRQRMQHIDLSGYNAKFPTMPANGNKARVENIHFAPDIYLISDYRDCDIPVAYLHDPLGVARDLAGSYQAAWKEMDQLLEDLRNPAHQGVNAKKYPFAKWFDSAVLANQYFFGKIPDFESEGLRPPTGKDKEQWVRAKVQREQWKKKLSKADIDQALGTVRRAELREKIKTTKKALVDGLDNPSSEFHLPLMHALDDYFTLPAPEKHWRLAADAPHYGVAWRMVERLIAKLGDHEYALDAGLEADPPNLHQLSENDPGAKLLLKLADPQQGHFLQSRLFPQPAGGNNPLQPKLVPSSANGPEFRPQHLRSTFLRDPEIFAEFFSHFVRVAGFAETNRARNNLLRLVNGALDLDLWEREITQAEYLSGKLPGGDVLLRTFALQEQFKGKIPGRDNALDFEDEPAQAETADPDSLQASRRSAQFAGGGVEHLNGVAQSIEKTTVTTDHSVLGKKGVDWSGAKPTIKNPGDYYQAQTSVQGRHPLSSAEAAHFDGAGQVQLPGGGKGTVQIYGHDGKLLGATSVSAFKQGKAFSRRQWRAKVHTTKWEEVTVRTIVNRQAKGLPALAKRLHDSGAWTRGVLPILVGVEVWNLQTAFKTLVKQWGTEGIGRAGIDLGGATVDLLAISGVVSEARVKHLAMHETGQPVDKILEKGGPWADKVRLSRMAARGLGTAAGIYSMGLSLHDMIENIRQGDDAAVAHGLMAGGFALTVIAESSGFLVAAGAATEASLVGSIAGGPWLWVGLGVVLSGAALLTWVTTEDSPLEEWLANGPFSLSQPAQLYEQELPGLGRRKYWREQNGTQLIFKEGDVLEKILYPAGGRFVEKCDGSVYLMEEHSETLVGKIGQPFTAWDKLMARSGRFAGHKPGTKAKDKFGRWCETPRSASLALTDAIYRPRLGLQINQNTLPILAAEISIQVPNFIEEKSLLFVELWENGAMQHQGIETFTGLGSGPRTVRIIWPLTGNGSARVLAKVRMDLYGNGDVWLPSLENSGNAWIEVEAVVDNPKVVDTRRIFDGGPYKR